MFIQNPYYRPISMFSYVRILHASPDSPAVDVYVNENPIATGLSYKQFTQYLPLAPGRYNINVFPSGQTTNPVIDTDFSLSAYSIYTLAAAGKLSDISLLPVPDPPMQIIQGKVYVKFVHLSPNAPAVDITLPDGTVLFGDIGFKEITNYIPLNPGTYELQARAAGTDQIVLRVPNITLTPDRFYSIYAVGLISESPPLQVLIPLDGNSYISFNP